MKTLFLSFILIGTMLAVKAQDTANQSDKITGNYIEVKNALAADNGSLAQKRAKELYIALLEPAKGLQPAQQKLLNTYLDKLKFDSRHISETTMIDHQREHFESLSKNLYSLLSGLKLNNTTLYQQYCPMKKAYWLSESADIRNPYYGSHMLGVRKGYRYFKRKREINWLTIN